LFPSAWGTSNFQYHYRDPYKLLEGLKHHQPKKQKMNLEASNDDDEKKESK